MKKLKQPENNPYQLPDVKEFSRRVIRKAFRNSIRGLIKECAIIIPAGILLGILIGVLKKRFIIDALIITGITVIAYVSLILYAGYCWYKYLKATGDDDE